MARRLWDKGETVNAQVHRFTVGSDPEVDLNLMSWDIVASAAHAKMLGTVDLLTPEQVQSVVKALQALHSHAVLHQITIPDALEDCHTTLESTLVESLGETGKRVHAGRSRNDQVLVAMRLYLKHSVLQALRDLLAVGQVFEARSRNTLRVPMPGYTHMQPAMPSSVGMWLHSFLEHIIELGQDGLSLLNGIDSNPLGVGAGFGVSLPLDRDMTTKTLHFARVQRNPIYVQSSRGRFELKCVRWLEDISSFVEKFACDVMLYSTEEYGFFTLPVEFTTGSSIMPQKRNPDVVELMRATSARVKGAAREIDQIITKLPSSYHRDFQLTKEPVVRAFQVVDTVFPLITQVVAGIQVHENVLASRMSDHLFATFEVFRAVKSGAAFRDAYGATAQRLKSGAFQVGDLRRDGDAILDAVEHELDRAGVELGQLSATVGQLVADMEQMVADALQSPE